ncbi:phosphoribosylglycinamide formyltransferase [Photobacterium sagamiensis]|uniref:phosphoribosylglycinamide formyltransferase n=1 Tax=Photobacterium sagamiensis TaxID=2910241 RepID=UPI003D0ACF49
MIVKSALRTCFVLFCVLSRSPVAAESLPVHTDSDYEVPSSSQGSKKSFQRSLSGLYSIPSWRQSHITQPYDDFDSLYQQAHQAQTELEQLIQQVSLSTDTQSQLPGIKSQTRAEYKISTELNGEVNRLTDLARGSLIARDIGSLVQAFELLSKKVTIVEVKNRFKLPATSGYRDLKMLVRLPQTQHIAEIQLHLQAISDIKNGAEHNIYEQLQTIERTASSQNRELNELEASRVNSLRNMSINLYQSVWQQYLQPERAVS